MSPITPYQERRSKQRFVATLRGTTWFWLVVNGRRQALNDLSLEGFSLAVLGESLPQGAFPFELHLDGINDFISGQAEAVNSFEDAGERFTGCRFVDLSADQTAQLHEWLTVHVVRSASVRISINEAEKIVSGRSLV